ncbi:MAG: hypothetical protein H7X92_11285 [Chitinophagales bacterium]|nr:hypothetical protein [Hyphomicrobiales bacterium]
MLDMINRFVFGRDRVRWALPKVGAVLKQHFGASGNYTAGQVKRALTETNAANDLHPLIYATACIEEEFLKAQPELTLEDYKTLRAETVKILDLPHSNLSMRLFMQRHSAEIGNSGEGGAV